MYVEGLTKCLYYAHVNKRFCRGESGIHKTWQQTSRHFKKTYIFILRSFLMTMQAYQVAMVSARLSVSSTF
jgi:hypothetical protein